MSNNYIYTNPNPDDKVGCILGENVLFSSDSYDLGLYSEEMRMVDYINLGVHLQKSAVDTSDAIRLMQYNLKGWGV